MRHGTEATQIVPREEWSPEVNDIGDVMMVQITASQGAHTSAVLCSYMTPKDLRTFHVDAPGADSFLASPWLAEDILADAGNAVIMGFSIVYHRLGGLNVVGFGVEPSGRMWHQATVFGIPAMMASPGSVEFFTQNARLIWGPHWEPLRPEESDDDDR